MTIKERHFLVFATVFIASSIAFIALISFFAARASFPGASAVGSGLAIMGAILVFSPVGVIAAAYVAWSITGQSRAFPRSGFAYRLPICALLGVALWFLLNVLTGGARSVPLELLIYFPAAFALLGALVAAIVTLRARPISIVQ